MKYLVVALVLLVALYLWKSARRGRNEASEQPPPKPGAASPARQIEMVRCEMCGVHLPREDAHASPAARGPRYFCSAEHRDAIGP